MSRFPDESSLNILDLHSPETLDDIEDAIANSTGKPWTKDHISTVLRSISEALEKVGKPSELPQSWQMKRINDHRQPYHSQVLYQAIYRGLSHVTRFIIGEKVLGSPLLDHRNSLHPLEWALRNRQPDMAKLLIELESPLQGSRWSALHVAVKAGLPDMVTFLVEERGMDPNQTINRETPFDYFANTDFEYEPENETESWKDQSSAITKLVSLGADVNASPALLAHARATGHFKLASLLLQLQANPGIDKIPNSDLVLSDLRNCSLEDDDSGVLQFAIELVSALSSQPSRQEITSETYSPLQTLMRFEVKSRTRLYIAETLLRAGVPLRPKAQLQITNKTISPGPQEYCDIEAIITYLPYVNKLSRDRVLQPLMRHVEKMNLSDWDENDDRIKLIKLVEPGCNFDEVMKRWTEDASELLSRCGKLDSPLSKCI